MPKHFLDRVPTEEFWETKIYGGFDSDLHQSAYAKVFQRESTYGAVEISDVYLQEFKIADKLRGFEAVQAMIQNIKENTEDKPDTFDCNLIIIEGQRLYPEKNATHQKLVGKANNLMSLAYISGAFHSLALDTCLYEVSLREPEKWKGQKQKAGMHKRAMRILNHIDIGEASIHQMDALCMALIAGGHKI